ncbi:MAG: hypothetical protein LBP56_00455 [Odoribacteraceae bacterium]|nr:hypothetical protein [Odoribacteraceae bacterium]
MTKARHLIPGLPVIHRATGRWQPVVPAGGDQQKRVFAQRRTLFEEIARFFREND